MYAVPQVQVVIEPGQESDVAIIVRYCNENSIEFLATNRGHGNPVSLASFNGIAINLVNLQSISIQPDGASAWFGGGTYDGQVNEYLWDEGYMATTGSCDCVGLLGAGLGGGHGRLEGLYGMVSDNFLQLNVVLGSGDAIVVNSTQHSHLLWGMKGAGHNFGIVTSFEMKIYPRGPDLWHYHNYVWRGEKLEDVFNALNNLQGNGTTPVNMTVNFGNFFMNTSITTEEPIIFWTFAYRGTAEEANQYLDAFTAIDYVFDEYGDVPYKEIASKQQTGVNDVICQHGNTRITSTAGLQVYNLTAERQIFDGFTRRLTTHPDLAAGCGILHEGYATAAVDAQNPDDSAYPFRSDHHLMLFDLVLPSGSNIYTEQAAWDWAFEVRDQWNNGQPERPVNAYVNYANGMESLGEKYGHEAWRLKKLWELKIKYDPFNRFRFYNPIVGV
ncbi:FAD-binding domain containing protein [Grosmannia clavigera kw1407]|uniref:FAD-binding domain containing protein n=1 Tax=Grosmannia clavigera (strain kw1407 / UAMH 11150) TaxID=655863 RepID=F0XI80_GROCL|nr:FAD-binding domain containing protein [Grosmannia clavigera kw1407]EFX02707.1 FAD-binding domain containing protein [Grosmannia clavigera kw1407]